MTVSVMLIDHTNTSPKECDAQDLVDILNGISWFCQEDYGYAEGWRNELAVNLTAASHMLGLKPKEMFDQFVKEKLIDPENDDENPDYRISTIMDYESRFDWYWMITPEWYANLGRDHKNDLTNLIFKLF